MYKKIIVILAIVVVLGIAGIVGLNIYENYVEEHRESDIVMPLAEHYGIPAGEAMIIVDEGIYDKNALWKNDEPYLDMDTAVKKYNHRFFWDEGEGRMYFTTASKEYIFIPGEKNCTINRAVAECTKPIVELKDNKPYISMSFLAENSNLTYRVYNDPERVLITQSSDAYLCAYVKEDTRIRVSQDIKADLLKEVKAGDKLRFIDGGGIQENGFIKVMSEDGVRGYILNEKLDESFYEDPVFATYTPEEYTHTLMQDKVYLGWHLLYTKNSLELLEGVLDGAEELTVVAPTWYFLNDTKGNFTSYANPEYTAKAHSNGVKVWATIKNDTIENVFKCTEDSHTLLSSYESRMRLIDNLLSAVETDGIDGINIDFELLKVDSGVYFIQFLRELSIECRAKKIILSVDNYVPENYNAYYNLSEQGENVDYVVIMGYDEHYAGSDAGSVSSLDWFTRAADNTLAKCSPEQIIMAVPFYTRLWKEEKDGDKVKTYVVATPGLKEAQKLFDASTGDKNWNQSAGQYYTSYEQDGATYKLWLEDKWSLMHKGVVIRERNLGGVAAWKLGDELPGIWENLETALEGELPEFPEDQVEIDWDIPEEAPVVVEE